LAAGAIVMSAKVKLALAGVVFALAGAWVASELKSGQVRARAEAGVPTSVDAASVERISDPRAESAATRIEQPTEQEVAASPPVDPRRVAKITGVVVGPKGKGPFAGARVELVRTIGLDLFVHPALRDGLPERRQRTVSAADGSFEFADLPRGVAFSIEASAEPDLFGTTSDGIRAGDHAYVTIAAHARLTGVVRRERGERVAGATVVARTVGGADVAIERRTDTDAAGRFALDRMSAWPVNVQAFTMTGDRMLPVRVELQSGAASDVELVFGVGFAVEGVVLDDRDARPISGARIFVAAGEGPGSTSRETESVPIAVADEAGRFRIQAGFEWVDPVLFASAKGFGFRGFVAPPPADPAPFVEVRLRPGRAIRGRVVDAEQRPVADAVVTFNGALEVADPKGSSLHCELGVARSAPDGSFRLEDVDGRSDHLLAVQHDGHAEAFVPARGATADVDVDVGDVVLRRGALVAGTVVDAAGRPVPRFRVFLAFARSLGGASSSADWRERFREQFFAMREPPVTFSRADGTFAFGDVAPGRWELSPSNVPDGSVRVPVTVDADEVLEGVELCVDEGRSISGRVVDDQGAPVTMASVYVERMPDPSRPKLFVAPPLPMRSVDLDGTFTLPRVPPGAYRVRARVVGSQRRTTRHLLPASVENVDAGRSDLTLVLPAGAFVFGKVQNADGTPHEHADVDAVDGDGQRLARVSSDPNGSFEMVVPYAEPATPPSSKAGARRVRLVVTGMPRNPFSSHPEPSGSMTVDDVELDGPEQTIRLPVPDR
jgi:protocatechuate 3,4-dioxygenase beta subunit